MIKITFDINGRNNDSLKDDFREAARRQGASDEQIDEVLSGDDWFKKLQDCSY